MVTQTTLQEVSENFLPGYAFHVYNRTNNKEILFFNDADKWRFVHGFKKYLEPYLKVYAYCLLDNHFHFQVRVRAKDDILQNCRISMPWGETRVQRKLLNDIDNEVLMSDFVSMQFSRFFNSYAKFFNHKYNRKGNLFNRCFKRKRITTEEYFRDLILYIHTNPRKHYGMELYKEYPWSSFQLIERGSVLLNVEQKEVIQLFGSMANFEKAHDEWLLNKPGL